MSALAEILRADATRRHRVVVIGGGNAGLSMAGRLRRSGVDDVVVVEPRTRHVYKPLLSHLSGGRARGAELVRDQGAVTPRGVRWINDSVTGVDPGARTVRLESGASLEYEHLIVCPGIVHSWEQTPGLAAAMDSPRGASNYELALALKASPLLRDLRRGTVVFSEPSGPASCSGAIQKPMYLACDYWRARGVLDDIRVVLLVPGPTVFGIPAVDAELDRKIAEYGIELRTGSELVAVDAEKSTVETATGESIAYDVLIAEPRQTAPDWIAASDLAGPDSGGFVDVDPATLRHRRHPEVWALGDAAATTNSKSGGAIRTQSAALVANMTDAIAGREPSARYDGYSVCPFTVSRNTVVLAEFDDRGRLKPTIPFWKTLLRERRLSWLFDRHILPWVYWHMILQGRA